ncbi:MAG: hypothetical protein ACM3U2_17365, partial [Deltaproteobacteria bacterium]
MTSEQPVTPGRVAGAGPSRSWFLLTLDWGWAFIQSCTASTRPAFRGCSPACAFCCGQAGLSAVFDRDVPFPGESNDFFNRPRVQQFVGADSSPVPIDEMANQVIVGGIGPTPSSRLGCEFDSRHITEPNVKNCRPNPEPRFNDEPVIADADVFQVLDRRNENDCDRTADDEDRS